MKFNNFSMDRGLILLVSQPEFPVPAIKDGAIAIVIQDMMASLTDYPIKCVSIWDEAHANQNFSSKRYLFYKKNAFSWRFLRKLFFQIPFYRSQLSGLTSKEQGVLVALKWGELFYRPRAVIVHTSKPEWVLQVKQFCDTNTRVWGYYHNSEVHHSPASTLNDLITKIDGHLFVSDFAANAFISSVSGLTCRTNIKVFAIKNGVDSSRFDINQNQLSVREKLGINPGKIVLLFAGRLIPRKGLHCLLKALLEIPDDVLQNIEVIVVGSHDYFNEQETEYISSLYTIAANERLKGKVQFVGYVPHNEMPPYYQASDIFIFPSIEDEGIGLSLIEAQMSSLPAIVSAVGGSHEALLPGVTGLLAEPVGDTMVIAQHIEYLVRNSSIRKNMGKKARQFSMDNFTREKMASDFWKIIETI